MYSSTRHIVGRYVIGAKNDTILRYDIISLAPQNKISGFVVLHPFSKVESKSKSKIHHPPWACDPIAKMLCISLFSINRGDPVRADQAYN
jgi:hypothetical protein